MSFFQRLHKKKEVPEQKQETIQSILMGYLLILDTLKKNPEFVTNHELLASTFLSCSLDKSISLASAFTMSISILAQKELVELMSKSLVDTLSYSESRNAEVCSYVSSKIMDIQKAETNILLQAENKMIKNLEELMK